MQSRHRASDLVMPTKRERHACYHFLFDVFVLAIVISSF